MHQGSVVLPVFPTWASFKNSGELPALCSQGTLVNDLTPGLTQHHLRFLTTLRSWSKTPSSKEEASNLLPERGMQSRWSVHGGSISPEKDGELQLLPFGATFLSLISKYTVPLIFFCVLLGFWALAYLGKLRKLPTPRFPSKVLNPEGV